MNFMKLLISCLLTLFTLVPNCYSQENNLTGKFHGYRSGASYRLECTDHNNGLYTLSGVVTYSSDGRGFRQSDSHYAYGGRKKGNSIRFTGHSYGNPKEEDIPLSTDAKSYCELYYEETSGKYYLIDYMDYGNPYEILYIVELRKSNVVEESSKPATKEKKKSVGILSNHEYVDLGLSVLWATCNVGASSPSESGNYYAWGEIEPKNEYCEYNSLTYNKYIPRLRNGGIIDSNYNLTNTYDVGTVVWGDAWRIPTTSEMQELIDNCKWEWTTCSGVKGCKITGQNGNYIFLPASGYYDCVDSKDAGKISYWCASASHTADYDIGSIYLHCGMSDSPSIYYTSFRYQGRPIRPVLK